MKNLLLTTIAGVLLCQTVFAEVADLEKIYLPPHIATFYNGPKGNIVFDAGSIWWAQGLSSPPGHVLPANGAAKPQGPDKRVQRMMKNVFGRFIKSGP